MNISGQQYEVVLGSQVSEGLILNQRVTGAAYACPDGLRFIASLQANTETALYSGTYEYDDAGRLTQKDGLTLEYSTVHPHAVTSATKMTDTISLVYNDNGDVITRTLSSGETLSFTYTREHKIEKVKRNNSAIPEHWFAYGADGERTVDKKADGTIVFYVGRHYEYSLKGEEAHQTQYYPEAGAMRVEGVLFYLLSDHLGSTSIVTDAAGNKLSEARYDAWGKTRYISSEIPTDRRYTGQRLSEDLGLYDYRARWYDPLLGRFLMEDTIIAPQGVMSLDRYSYAKNAPIRYTDPSGNCVIDGHQMDDSSPACQGIARTGPLPDEPDNPPLVLFSAEDGQEWSDAEKEMIMEIIYGFADMYASTINDYLYKLYSMGEIDSWERITPEEAFRRVHGGAIEFIRKSVSCNGQGGGCAGQARDENTIWIYSNASENYILNHPGLIVHEVNHSFNVATGRQAQNDIPQSLRRPLIEDGIDRNGNTIWRIDHGTADDDFYGYAGGWDVWQFGWSSTWPDSEEFADMGVGFYYNEWGDSDLAKQRRQHMQTMMLVYLLRLINP